MTDDFATHISLLAAPLYAAMLAPYLASGREVAAEHLEVLRETAITQAKALWLQTMSDSTKDRPRQTDRE
jgi:hypothetical protein